MNKSPLYEQLNNALETRMAAGDWSISDPDPRIAEVLRIAGELRALPHPDFRDALKEFLFPQSVLSATAKYGPALSSASAIKLRLRELALAPRMIPYDVNEALADLPDLSSRFIASLDHYTLGVARYSSQQPSWERHPSGDELLHVLNGVLDVTTLTDRGAVHSRVETGAVFVCPAGLWHWPRPIGEVSVLFLTPGKGTQHSRAALPDGPEVPTKNARVIESSKDILEICASVPELRITSDTTAEEANAAVGQLGWMGDHALGVMRYSGLTPWERHPDGDELLHTIDGQIDVTVLTEDGILDSTLTSGSLFICPKGLWHRQVAKPMTTVFYATPIRTSEVSFADDPRVG